MIVRYHQQPQYRMDITKKILVLTLLQGLLPGLLCQRWEFPSEIVGLIGSCVEIPYTPSPPELTGGSTMYEARPEVVTCSVEHTCGSSPPSLKWNKPGQTERRSEALFGGKWREISRLTYIPSHEDDKTQIRCTATYPNGRTARNAAILSIRYAPKDVTVSLPKDTAFVEGNDVILTCNSRSNPPPLRYEWYRTNSKIKLEPRNQKIQVLNVNRKNEPFSCAAINDVGRGESPPTKISMQYAATGVQVIVLHPAEGATELKCSFESSSPNVTHYTWIKDRNTLVKEVRQILVLDSNEDESGSYYCIAHNTAGSSNSPQLDFRDSNGAKHSPNLILILGVLAGVILLIIVVYFYTRIKAHQKSIHENSQRPDATFTDLVETEVSNGYELMKNSQRPDATFTDLVETEVSNGYELMKPSFPAPPAAGGIDLTSDDQYENLQRKE